MEDPSRTTRATVLIAAHGFALIRIMEFLEKESVSPPIALILVWPLVGMAFSYLMFGKPRRPFQSISIEAIAVGTLIGEVALWAGYYLG